MSLDNQLTAAIAAEVLAELDSLLPLFANPARREEVNTRLGSLEVLHAIVTGEDQRRDPRS